MSYERVTRRLGVGIVLSLLLAGSLSAFVLLSPRRWWDNPPTLIVDDRGQASVVGGDHGLAATNSAINSNQAWNGAGSGNVINAIAGSVASWQLGDGIPMLSFEDPANGCKGTCLAATYTGFASPRGDGTYSFDDADIVTNTRYNWTATSETDGCSGEAFVEGVMVHEVGHLLGLDHTNVVGATMYPSVSACNNGPATTEADDEAGLNALYSGTGGGGVCTLLPAGAPCTANSQCCSGSCKGKPGLKKCQ